jgi:tetratricopeptide (TPR) repeat protein/transcriptional regulator with XRE-family HTH domain
MRPPLTAAVRLGRELRRLRLERGLSQRGLVRALGLSAHSNLVQYELGRRIPPGDIVTACERLLGDTAGSLRRLRAEALAELARTGPGQAQPAPAPPAPAGVERGPVPTGVPAMLPAAVADFTGRTAQLAQLAALAGADDAPTTVVVTAIAGTAGVGKTALAVRFGHEIRGHFPDGQLYLDLRGYAPTPPLTPSQALAVLLHALGEPVEQVPADPERAAGRYRSLLAGKRMLIVLDNAHRADQVRPLLPGTSGCLVLVTSRDRLGGLVARDGARRLTLDVLSADEAEVLLGRILGRQRVTAEPEAVADLARRCAYLPLALRIAAANLADQPHRDIAGYVAELAADGPLAALTVPGDEQGAVRVAFSSSYTRMPAAARRLFRLLGLVPGPDVTVDAAAALAGVTRAEAAGLLTTLVSANLIAEPAAGRFTCHDLLRRYAGERARRDEGDHDRAAAVARLLDWYLHTTNAAGRLLYPGMSLLAAPEPRSGVFADDVAALGWLEAERANLLAAVQHTAVHGPHPAAWLLADALRGYFWLRLYTADWMATARAGLTAAEAAGARRAEAASRLSLADAYQSQARHRRALAQYTEVLALTRQEEWIEGQVATLNGLGRVYWQIDRLEEAVDHLSQALAIDRATGSVRGQAMRLANLGAMYHEMGRLSLAADHYEQALAITRETGQRRGEGICLANLGMTYHELGSLSVAFDHLGAALTLARETGDTGNEAHVLRILAEAHADAGRPDRALAFALEAVTVADNIDDRHYEVETCNTLAGVHERRGEHDKAIDGYRRALKLARDMRTRYPEIVALIGLSTAYRYLDRPDEALTAARQALALARRTGYHMLAGHALTALAEAYRALDRADQAVKHARRAVAVHRATGHRLGEARSLVALGHVLWGTGASDAAGSAWTKAEMLFTDIGTPVGMS